MDVTVCVPTFGESRWVDLAMRRAIPSARATGAEVRHAHAATLHDARNVLLAGVPTDWVCFLDADDELAPDYFERMAAATADVRAPAVQYVDGHYRHQPYVPQVVGPDHDHDCRAECLRDGNWLVVGAVARTQLLRDVGGWKDWPLYEDFDLWQRCWLAGATMEGVPHAIYVAHRRQGSRNHGLPRSERHQVHQAINDANGVVPAWAVA